MGPQLVDSVEAAQPREEEEHHSRIAVRELDGAIGLAAFARVQGRSGDQELSLAEPTDAFDALRKQAFDLCLLGPLELVGPTPPRAFVARQPAVEAPLHQR